jgi:hypothetical protein
MKLKEENDNKTDIWLKLRVKQTALKKELDNLNVGKKDVGEESEDSNRQKDYDKNSANSNDDAIEVGDVKAGFQDKDSYDHKNLEP